MSLEIRDEFTVVNEQSKERLEVPWCFGDVVNYQWDLNVVGSGLMPIAESW